MSQDGSIYIGSGLQPIWNAIDLIAPTDATVLILGESGTGKELVAEAIHKKSKRKDQSFIKRNCAALAEGVLESELFGHEKGAFTGADKRTLGIFELAHQGTIFLDEISELTPKTQAKLLRILQEKEFQRVGGATTIRVDVRIIAASNKNLIELISNGLFREDLYWRLNVVKIEVPPLRTRRQDIPGLIEHFLKVFNGQYNRYVLVSETQMAQLMLHDWPGNVRELKNAIERAILLSKGPELTEFDFGLFDFNTGQRKRNLVEKIFDDEKSVMETALIESNGNISESARLLNMARSSFRYRAKRLSLL